METPTPSPTSTLTPTQTHTPTLTPTYQWVTVGSIVSQDGENDHNIEFDHEVEDGEDRLLVVTYAHRRNSGQSVYAVKYNGASMTQAAGDSIAGDYVVAIYYLVNPPVGTHEVSIHLTETAKTIAGAFTLYGVDLYDPIVDTDETTVWGLASLTLDSNPGDMAVDASVATGTGSLSFGTGQTLQWTDTMTWTGGGMRSGSSIKSSDGTQITTSCNISSSRQQAYVAAVFRAAQADAPTPTPSITPTATPTESPEQGWAYAYYEYSSIDTGPHAVTGIDRGVTPTDAFEYDNIGNMIDRKENSTDWSQTFNEEGRLSQISDSTDTWDFTYDGEGVRVKQENPDGSTTLFLGGGAYEVHIDGQTTTVKKYYAIAGQRVMRDNSGDLHYLLTDHLGSVVAVLDETGSIESDERYLPFGGLRDSSGISETDFAFTGQRNLSEVDLMDYNARFYSPSIGRFISADTIVTGPVIPQSLNRLTYVLNNPLGYIDPSGHDYELWYFDKYGKLPNTRSYYAEYGMSTSAYTPYDSEEWPIITRLDPEDSPFKTLDFQFTVGPAPYKVDSSIGPLKWGGGVYIPGFDYTLPDPTSVLFLNALKPAVNIAALFAAAEAWKNTDVNVFAVLGYTEEIDASYTPSYTLDELVISNLSPHTLVVGDIVVSNGIDAAYYIVGTSDNRNIGWMPPTAPSGETAWIPIHTPAEPVRPIYGYLDVQVRISRDDLYPLWFQSTKRIGQPIDINPLIPGVQ